jgi:hypothetical protein
MGFDHMSHGSALRAVALRTTDIKYLTWFVSSQHLFGRHPSVYMVCLDHMNMTPSILRKPCADSRDARQHHSSRKWGRGGCG